MPKNFAWICLRYSESYVHHIVSFRDKFDVSFLMKDQYETQTKKIIEVPVYLHRYLNIII